VPDIPAALDPGTCYLYLVRHGATENNRAARLQGRQSHHPLSEQGRAQALLLSELLASRRIGQVYSSPLLRAMQTAERIAAAHGLEVRPLAELVEVDVGRWEGRSWSEIAETEAEAYAAFMQDPAVHPYAGGETITQVAARVAPAIDALYERHLGEAIVVVAHSVVNRAYLATQLGLPLSLTNRLSQENCAVNLLRHRGGKTRVLSVNSLFHLDQV